MGPEALKREAAVSSPRVFTIPEVNALIPTLNLLVAQQLRQRSDIEQGLAELTRLSRETPLELAVHPTDSAELRRLKQDLRHRIRGYEAGWNRIRELGGVIKDAQIGLVDFYGRIDGRTVWLCWRYGEDSLGYYHEIEEGYSGRRPLSANVRKHTLN